MAASGGAGVEYWGHKLYPQSTHPIILLGYYGVLWMKYRGMSLGGQSGWGHWIMSYFFFS